MKFSAEGSRGILIVSAQFKLSNGIESPEYKASGPKNEAETIEFENISDVRAVSACDDNTFYIYKLMFYNQNGGIVARFDPRDYDEFNKK